MSSKFKLLSIMAFGLCCIAIDGASGRQCRDIIQECVDKSKQQNRRELDPCESWKGITSTTAGPSVHTNDPLVACYTLYSMSMRNFQFGNWPWTCGTTCADLKPGIGCEGDCAHIR